MRKSFKIVGGLAVVGLIAAGSAAFTATGVTTTGQADAPQFVGGVISQTVTGATLETIVYGFLDPDTKTAVDTVTLTFAEQPILPTTPTIGVTSNPANVPARTFGCTQIDSGGVSTCSIVHIDLEDDGAVNVTQVDVTVPSVNVS